MKLERHHLTGLLALALAVIVMILTGKNFLEVRELPLPMWGPSVTEVKMLSDWFPGLKGTNGDTEVYVLKGQ